MSRMPGARGDLIFGAGKKNVFMNKSRRKKPLRSRFQTCPRRVEALVVLVADLLRLNVGGKKITGNANLRVTAVGWR